MRIKFIRSREILGNNNMEKIKNANILILGLGGVGSYAAEGLVRMGLENITIVDYDYIDITNFNRQIHATIENLGESKVSAMKNRILSINMNVKISCIQEFYSDEKKNIFLNKNFSSYDYVVDAIDTISSKINIANICYKKNIPIISSMGTGNKLDPTKFKVLDLFKTDVDPMARVMRKELKKLGVKKLKVVCSTENPIEPNKTRRTLTLKEEKKIGSVSYVPPVVGFIIVHEIIKYLINN